MITSGDRENGAFFVGISAGIALSLSLAIIVRVIKELKGEISS